MLPAGCCSKVHHQRLDQSSTDSIRCRRAAERLLSWCHGSCSERNQTSYRRSRCYPQIQAGWKLGLLLDEEAAWWCSRDASDPSHFVPPDQQRAPSRLSVEFVRITQACRILNSHGFIPPRQPLPFQTTSVSSLLRLLLGKATVDLCTPIYK